MKGRFWNFCNRNPEKGGFIGALIGLLIARQMMHPDHSPVKKPKTALYTGAVFITGKWIEKWISS